MNCLDQHSNRATYSKLTLCGDVRRVKSSLLVGSLYYLWIGTAVRNVHRWPSQEQERLACILLTHLYRCPYAADGWMGIFGVHSLTIVSYEDFKKYPHTVYASCMKFLGVPPELAGLDPLIFHQRQGAAC